MKIDLLRAMCVSLIAACLIVAGCWADKQEGINETNTLMFRSRSSDDLMLIVDIIDVSSGRRISEFKTNASVVHRFALNWIAPDKILLVSSDDGNSVICVGDVCKGHYADVYIMPDCAEAQLWDYPIENDRKKILDTIKFDRNILLNDKRVNPKNLIFTNAHASGEVVSTLNDKNGTCSDDEGSQLAGQVSAWRSNKVQEEGVKRPCEFYGIKFGEPSSVPPNSLERQEGTGYCTVDGVAKHYKYAYWVGSDETLRPASIFDFVNIVYSYVTVTPSDATFYAHFPKGMTRKDCIAILDSIAADVKARYGIELKARGTRQNEEEPADFVPGEVPGNLARDWRRYTIKPDGLFYQKDGFSFQRNLSVQLVAGETCYGERCATLTVLDQGVVDREKEGIISAK